MEIIKLNKRIKRNNKNENILNNNKIGNDVCEVFEKNEKNSNCEENGNEIKNQSNSLQINSSFSSNLFSLDSLLNTINLNIVIIGGGISGICCSKEINRILNNNKKLNSNQNSNTTNTPNNNKSNINYNIIVISSSEIIKEVFLLFLIILFYQLNFQIFMIDKKWNENNK